MPMLRLILEAMALVLKFDADKYSVPILDNFQDGAEPGVVIFVIPVLCPFHNPSFSLREKCHCKGILTSTPILS